MRLSPKKKPSAITAGTTSAVSLSQYWNACTNVIDRMPPISTVTDDDHPRGGDTDPVRQAGDAW